MIKSQVVSLDLAMRLRELRLKKESIFLWEYYNEKCYDVKFSPFAVCGEYDGLKLYPAYTASELLELLPYEIYNQSFILTKACGEWEVKYQEGEYPE